MAKAILEPTSKARHDLIVMKNEPVFVVLPQKAENLMELLGNIANIIRQNDANDMEVNFRAVHFTYYDELYANLFAPHGTQRLPGMAVIISALRQCKVAGKNIISNRIQASYERAIPHSGFLYHNEKAIPIAVKQIAKTQPKHKRRSTSPLKIEETGPPKNVTLSTTKYNMPRKRVSAVT